MIKHLVIQGPVAQQPAAIQKLTAISQAKREVTLGRDALRLEQVRADEATRQAVTTYADAVGLDVAFVPAGQRLADFKVLAMDMDSTLINIESIDEIADAVGRKAEVAAITEAAMRGEISDYKDSLRRRVALLEGLPIEVLHQVYEQRLRLNRGAEALVRGAHALGLKTLLVSGGFTFFTGRLRERLSISEARSNVLEIENDQLTGRLVGDIIDADGKAHHLRVMCERLKVLPRTAIAVGDGANDLKMMEVAGIGVAYRAKPVVRRQATVALNVAPLDGILNLFEDTAGQSFS